MIVEQTAIPDVLLLTPPVNQLPLPVSNPSR